MGRQTIKMSVKEWGGSKEVSCSRWEDEGERKKKWLGLEEADIMHENEGITWVENTKQYFQNFC